MRNSRLKKAQLNYKHQSNRRAIAFLLILTMLFALPLGVFGAAGNSAVPLDLLGKNVTTPGDEAFDSLTMEAGMVQGKEFSFTFNFELSNDYLTNLRDNWPSELPMEIDTQASREAINLALKDDSNFPSIGFEVIFSGDDFDPANPPVLDTPITDKIVNGQDTKIGLYSISQDSTTHDIKFVATLDKYLYAVLNVVVGKTVSLNLKDDKRDGQTPSLKLNSNSGL